MPDWVRDILRVVLLFALPVTVVIAGLYTVAIASSGELPSPSQTYIAYALWLLAGLFVLGLWGLRSRRRGGRG